MTVTQQITASGVSQSTTGCIFSKDGTKIGYRQLGKGPALVIVHGAMESAQSHTQLGEALASAFTITLYDRRGRGMSGPSGNDYSMQAEVDDLHALLTQADARYIFGVSSGALIALQAALTLPGVTRAAIFEPPLSVNGSASTAFLPRYDQEIAQGKVSAALVTGMLGAQMGPPVFNNLPRWLLELLTTMMMNREDRKARPEDVTWRKLAPTLHNDFALVREMSETLERFSSMEAEILLLGGSASPAYLKTAVDALEKVLPRARRVEFHGLDHGASGNTDQHGQPERVAQELLRFFA